MAGEVVRVTVPDRPMREKGFDIDARTLRPARAGDRIEVECVDHHCTHHGDAPAFYRDSCNGSGSRWLTLTEDPVDLGLLCEPNLSGWLLVGVTDE